MSFVLKYMFVVSIAVIVPLLGLVVYTTRRAIGKVLLRLEQSIATWKWFPKFRWQRGRQMPMKECEEDDNDGDSDASVTDIEHEKRLSKLRFWKAGKEVDAEKGG